VTSGRRTPDPLLESSPRSRCANKKNTRNAASGIRGQQTPPPRRGETEPSIVQAPSSHAGRRRQSRLEMRPCSCRPQTKAFEAPYISLLETSGDDVEGAAFGSGRAGTSRNKERRCQPRAPWHRATSAVLSTKQESTSAGLLRTKEEEEGHTWRRSGAHGRRVGSGSHNRHPYSETFVANEDDDCGLRRLTQAGLYECGPMRVLCIVFQRLCTNECHCTQLELFGFGPLPHPQGSTTIVKGKHAKRVKSSALRCATPVCAARAFRNAPHKGPEHRIRCRQCYIFECVPAEPLIVPSPHCLAGQDSNLDHLHDRVVFVRREELRPGHDDAAAHAS
jgi:hypothetical protein